MRRLLLIMLSMLMVSLQLLAQNRTISGKVTDAQGNGVANASVAVKGGTVGTTTDINGSFNLSVPPNVQSLVISSIGFQTQEITIGSRTNVNVTLSATTETLGEVVVTGYTREKRDNLPVPQQ